MHAPTDNENPVGPHGRMLQGRPDEIVADNFEWENQPQDDQSAFGLNASSVSLGVELAHKVKQEVSDYQSQDGTKHWCGVNCRKVTVTEFIGRDDKDRDSGVVGDGPWNWARLA